MDITVVRERAWGIEGVLETLRSAQESTVERAVIGGDRVLVCATGATPDHGCANRDSGGFGREGVVGDRELDA